MRRVPRRLVPLHVVSAVTLMGFAAIVGCSTDSETDSRADSRTESTAASRTPPGPERELDGIAYPVWAPDAYAGREVATGLRDIASLGARTVTIVPTWYADDTSASSPHRDPEQTPTDDSVRAAIAEAHRLGMQVLLKPHVDLPGDEDRADIRPADPAAWFGAYRTMIVGYASMAAETGVEVVSVGTELAGTMDLADEWSATIDAVRGVYSGQLTYAANFDSYAEVPFWPRLDVIGVDAYFELVDTPTTDVDTLVAAWTPVLDGMAGFAAERGKPVMFTEAGYVSQRGSTTQPWNWEISRKVADDEQAAAYRALLDAVGDRTWFVGVQWWMWDDLADTGEDQSLDYTPHGKPAEQVLRDAWGGR